MSRHLYVGRGLTHKEAWRIACQKAKSVKWDFRGIKYDAVTGWAALT